LGVLLGYALGVAPAEETFFRGLLLPQLRLKFSELAPAVAVGAALAVSQLLFALYHLPSELLGGSSGVGMGALDIAIDVGRLFLIGLLYAALYLRTGNLFLVIGIHAVEDAGITIVAAPLDPGLVILGLAAVTLLTTFIPAVARWLRGVNTPVSSRMARFTHDRLGLAADVTSWLLFLGGAVVGLLTGDFWGWLIGGLAAGIVLKVIMKLAAQARSGQWGAVGPHDVVPRRRVK
jgi:hypothetical protein